MPAYMEARSKKKGMVDPVRLGLIVALVVLALVLVLVY